MKIEFSGLENNIQISTLFEEGRRDEALKLILKELVSDRRILAMIE